MVPWHSIKFCVGSIPFAPSDSHNIFCHLALHSWNQTFMDCLIGLPCPLVSVCFASGKYQPEIKSMGDIRDLFPFLSPTALSLLQNPVIMGLCVLTSSSPLFAVTVFVLVLWAGFPHLEVPQVPHCLLPCLFLYTSTLMMLLTIIPPS